MGFGFRVCGFRFGEWGLGLGLGVGVGVGVVRVWVWAQRACLLLTVLSLQEIPQGPSLLLSFLSSLSA